MKDRKFTKSKILDFEYFRGENFEFTEWLKEYGLERFLTEKEEVYEHLIRLFYFYLKWDESMKKYTSYVQGVFIAFNLIEFAQIMLVPFDMEDEISDVTVAEKIVFLTNRQNLPPATIQSKFLKSVDYRVLFNVICNCIYPRAGGFDKVTLDDIDLMYAILKGAKMSLANTMIEYMLQQKGRNNGRLPFGMSLTRMFKHFKVDLRKEKSVKFNSYNTINESTLKRMRIIKRNGQWVDKNEEEEEEEEVEEQAQPMEAPAEAPQAATQAEAPPSNQEQEDPGFDHFSFSDLMGSSPPHHSSFPDPPSTSQPTHQPSSSQPTPPTQVDLSPLMSFLETQFTQLNSRMSTLESKVDRATTEIQTIKTEVSNQLTENQTKMDFIESSINQHCPPLTKSMKEIENYLKIQQDALMKTIQSATISLQDLRDNSDRVCLHFKLPTLPELLRELEAQVRREYEKMRKARPPPKYKKDKQPRFVPQKRKTRSPTQSPPHHSPAHIEESGGSNQPLPKAKAKESKEPLKTPKPEIISSESSSSDSKDGSYNSDPTY